MPVVGVAGRPPPPHPAVIAVADHFQLGEPVLPSVLQRWAKGISVQVRTLRTGQVRIGMRRTPVGREEEEAALAARVRELGLEVWGSIEDDGGNDHALPKGVGAAVFVVDADGRLVARMSGKALDPRPLDPVVARLAKDPAAIAPPK
jgi:hypothetical protein